MYTIQAQLGSVSYISTMSRMHWRISRPAPWWWVLTRTWYTVSCSRLIATLSLLRRKLHKRENQVTICSPIIWSHGYHTTVTSVTSLSHDYHIWLSHLSHVCHMTITWLSHVCHMTITWSHLRKPANENRLEACWYLWGLFSATSFLNPSLYLSWCLTRSWTTLCVHCLLSHCETNRHTG